MLVRSRHHRRLLILRLTWLLLLEPVLRLDWRRSRLHRRLKPRLTESHRSGLHRYRHIPWHHRSSHHRRNRNRHRHRYWHDRRDGRSSDHSIDLETVLPTKCTVPNGLDGRAVATVTNTEEDDEESEKTTDHWGTQVRRCIASKAFLLTTSC